MEVALRRLRSQAARHTLFAADSLQHALALLPFVQADPIRAPARAQDLILRQRVEGYRVGDLERAYPDLDLEEGYLYAYGFLPRLIWQIRHPPNVTRLTVLEKKILARVAELGVVHPEALRAELGTRSAVNGWGGQSTRVKLALESLHRRGLVRVARRRNGIRMYQLCPPLADVPSPQQIFSLVATTVVRVLAPAPERAVRSIMARLTRRIRGARSPAKELAVLIESGVLERQVVSDVAFLSLGEVAAEAAAAAEVEGTTRRVRFLAPFDPLVWDRQRFELLWGWSYRFEAYTPAKKRVRGYYAMPLCYGESVIGWANVEAQSGELDVDLGFVGSRPRGREFRLELDAEVERLREFLVPPAGAPLDFDASSIDADRPIDDEPIDGSAAPDSGPATASELAVASPDSSRAAPEVGATLVGAALEENAAPGTAGLDTAGSSVGPLRGPSTPGSSRRRASRRSPQPRS
jgi:uncharacterized protein YcaQ